MAKTPPPPPKREYHPPRPQGYKFHFLEVSIVSAQDLYPASNSMRTYTLAYVEPENKFRSRQDPAGHNNPVWNDKYLFRVTDETLRSETSGITFEVYSVKSRFLPGSDTLLGTTRALISTLQPSTEPRFVALQVRRPTSLRPQGILNIGVRIVDTRAKSAPLQKRRKREKAPAAAPPPPAPAAPAPAVKVVKTHSMVMVEKKLEKWREELPMPAPRPHEERRKERRRERPLLPPPVPALKPVSRRTNARHFAKPAEVH